MCTRLEHDDIYPEAIVARMRELGLFGATIAAEYGGLGLPCATYADIVERIARVWMSLTGIFNSHLIMSAIVQRNGTEAQKRAFLPRFASGELRGGLALTEPDCGTDLQAIRVTARRDGDAYVVNGTKTWISNGIHGSCFALLVKTDPDAEPRHRGMSMLLAEKGPGFTVSRKLEKLGYKGIDSAELVFQDYRVPADRLIGGVEGRGLQHALSGLELGRINVAARGVGIAQAALDESLRYAQLRKTFGVPIAQHQAIQLKLADMATRTEASRLLVRRAAEMYDRGDRCDMEAGMAKLFATETALENATEAMRVHGGYGYSTEFPVERLYRDAPLLVIGEGTNELQRIIIARQLVARNPGVMLPLAGVRILAVEQYGAGPFGSMQLADMGAEVIKIENPAEGGDVSRSVGSVFPRRARQPFLPGVQPQQALHHAEPARTGGAARAARSCGDRGCGAGQSARRSAAAAGRDLRPIEVCQSAHRVRAPVGVWPRGRPRVVARLRLSDAGGSRLPVADRRAGSAAGAVRTVHRGHDGGRLCGDRAARRHRVGTRNGCGARRRCQPVRHRAGESELPGGVVLNGGHAQGREPRGAHPSLTPSQLYRTADGWIFIMCNKQKFWPVLCEKLGQPEWSDDPRFASFKARLENRAELTRLLDAALSARGTAAWLEHFAGAVPAAPVHDIAHALGSEFVTREDRVWAYRTSARCASAWWRRRSAFPARRCRDRVRRRSARTPTRCWRNSATTRTGSQRCARPA